MKSFKYFFQIAILLVAFNSSAQNFYSWVEESRIPQEGTRWIVPRQFKTIQVNIADLKSHLKTVPIEFTGESPLTINLPLPDGTNMPFNSWPINILT